jgi:hypothetical protein
MKKRQNRTPLVLVLGCAAFLFLSSNASANIVIKVRALNPLESDETASISYPLPADVTPADIIEKKITFSLPPEEDQAAKTTFNIEYKEEEGRYYIVDEVPLGPREVVTLEVHVRDIWSIAPETLSGKKEAVQDLVSQYHAAGETAEEEAPPEETETAQEEAAEEETIASLKEQIFMELEEIETRQSKNTVFKVGVEKHMEAYYENLEALRQLDADIEMLRYLLEPEDEESLEGEEILGEEEAPEELKALEVDLQQEKDAGSAQLQEEAPLLDSPSEGTLTQEGQEGSEK